MLVRSDLFAEDGERRVAIGPSQISELLIVGTVLLDDVDDVFDLRRHADLARNDCRGRRRTSFGEQGIVVGRVLYDPSGQLRKLLLQVGDRKHFDTAFLQRLHRLVAVEFGGQRTARTFSVRMSLFSLGVADEKGALMIDQGKGRRVPASRDKTDYGSVCAVRDVGNGDRVVVRIRYVE